MPRRTDIASVLVIGSGPIVIGQACEFDYSGTQACRVLRAEGLRVVLVNSNPATIMTDPEFADATYIEPITAEFVTKIIEKERPDALLATLGGQTALNVATELSERGVLEEFGVELIGASIDAIRAGENRQSFKSIVQALPAHWQATVADSVICHDMADCLAAAAQLGYPVVVRPSFTMGGSGSGMAYQEEDLRRIAGPAVAGSPGPLEKKTPSGCRVSTSPMPADAGSSCTSIPRPASIARLIDLIPRSTATTVCRRGPTAG